MVEASLESPSAHSPTLTELADRVAAFGDAVEFELGPGLASKHLLCITAANQPAKRAAVARLMRAAPAADAAWEYHETRPAKAIAGAVLAVGECVMPVSEARIRSAAQADEPRLDVAVDHPAFAQLDEAERASAAVMLLDIVLGELDVERYVGSIEARTLRWRSQPIATLTADVAELHRTRISERAEGIVRWQFVRDIVDGEPKIRTIDRDVQHCEHPLLDARFYLAISLFEPSELGFTTDEEAEVMYQLEDEIKAELGTDAVLVARDTNGGFRTLHFYYDTQSTALATLKQRIVTLRSAGRTISLTGGPDPAWKFAASMGLS
jgi:hypothetical protein